MSDIHAQIHSFLQQQNIQALPGGATANGDQDGYTKAGVIPFMRKGDGLMFYVMKPVAKRLDIGVPPFQLCKGTRQFRAVGAGWRDIRGKVDISGEIEPLAATALREGIEELGLQLENIKRMSDIGSYGFASATTGQDRHMWLFALEMALPELFLPHEAVRDATMERRWLSRAEFDIVGREDHRYILADIENRLIQAQE